MARVVLTDVEKVYPGGMKAVQNFSLDIADEEFVVFVGPSGCGKSTTLRCVAGLEDITAGTIHIGERLVNDVPPKDRDIAMVFQNYALYPHMSVFENMSFALKLRKTPRDVIEQKVRKAAKILGIEQLLDRKPKTLSGGQRQRVALGRAIVRDPKCFLFDEPLSNLDAKLRGEMRAEIKRLHMDLRSTTIYVTHDQEEAMTLGDRVVVMKDGVIQQCGAPLDVYHRPINRFVAGFVGTPAMNFFEGTIARESEKLWFDEGSGKLAVPDWAKDALDAKVGSKVVMGVRPQAISDRPIGAMGMKDNVLPMKVGVVEPLGDKMDVYLSTASHGRIVAHIDAHRGLSPNETRPMHIDLNRLHFFETGGDGVKLATAPVAA
ncbi:MAG TPA: sn-glycerol-3-phosphate ABC transporter ATP-binding protein UgpC [Polyangiaceae bacterium]|nr:sn-glycerol-3-phosphate ABC transporter ATP-binding protein UgpC [Polyangiaceae bacterium]